MILVVEKDCQNWDGQDKFELDIFEKTVEFLKIKRKQIFL